MRDFAILHGNRVPHPPFIAGSRPFIRNSSFYATGFPPGKSGVSAQTIVYPPKPVPFAFQFSIGCA